MATNELLPFGMGDSPNRIPFEDWNTLPARLTGFQSGIASSQQFNYILAQGGIAGYILGQLIVDFAQQDATLDNADALYTSLKNALAAFVPGNIADKSILTAKIADAAITTIKIADANVTTGKIDDKAVTTAKLADLAVTAAQLAANAVTNAKIAAGTIAFDRIASASIASESEAKAGTATNKLMTPQRVAQAITAQIPPSIPSGFILPFAGTSIPDGWLICNGAAVSRTEYAALFSAIGTTWGEGTARRPSTCQTSTSASSRAPSTLRRSASTSKLAYRTLQASLAMDETTRSTAMRLVLLEPSREGRASQGSKRLTGLRGLSPRAKVQASTAGSLCNHLRAASSFASDPDREDEASRGRHHAV